MICIPADLLRVLNLSNNSVCIWVFKSTAERDRFVKESAGMQKDERTAFFDAHFA
jgi:serine/threonine protein kinase HipA of HipAB toxin-antitoxin module